MRRKCSNCVIKNKSINLLDPSTAVHDGTVVLDLYVVLVISVSLSVNVWSLRKIFSNYIFGRKGKRILDLSVGKHGGTVVLNLSVVLALSPIVAQMFDIWEQYTKTISLESRVKGF